MKQNFSYKRAYLHSFLEAKNYKPLSPYPLEVSAHFTGTCRIVDLCTVVWRVSDLSLRTTLLFLYSVMRQVILFIDYIDRGEIQ